jgi:integrating conjugative element relaxase (TIGR03760 family)
LFERLRKNTAAAPAKSLKDLTPMSTAEHFLAEHRRQELIHKIRDFSGLEAAGYESLWATLIDNLVHYCQYLPESINSYYAQPGGLVDYALNRTEVALDLFQEFMIHDKDAGLSEEQKLWQYALFSAAILQGIGKLFIDYQVNLYDHNRHLLKSWNPLIESLVHVGRYYDYEFQKDSDIEFRRRLNLLMAKALMPASGFDWIASNPEVLAIWLALLNEDQRGAATLGALLIRAEAIAIQRYYSEFYARIMASRGGHLGRPGTFSDGVPESLLDKEQAVGVQFIQWMVKAFGAGIIMINKAPLLSVPGGLLMCPEMFQLFVREHPEYKNWQAIQKAFLSLNLHGYAADGGLNSRFEQTQNQKIHEGIIFAEYAVALPASVPVHNINTGRTQTMSAIDFIHNSQENNHFIPHQNGTREPLQQLAPSGQWQNAESEAPNLKNGAKRGV